MQAINSAQGKQNHIAAALKHDMMQGRVTPGERLPAFSVLERRFDVSRLTLQLAIQRLQREGFVRTVPRQGTFVSERLPYTHCFAVVLPPLEMPSNRFWMNLSAAAEELQSHLDCKIEFFRDVLPKDDDPAFKGLQESVRQHMFAGLVFPEPMSGFEATSLVCERQIPIVSLGKDQPEGVMRVLFDAECFVQRACEAFKQRGRERVAVISRPTHTLMNRFVELIQQNGLSIEPYCALSVSRHNPDSAANITTLLLNLPDCKRPDAIIITDDNLVEHALSGVLRSGLNVGKDLDVVAHCNWPWSVHSSVPVLRLGFDVSEVLESSIRMILASRSGKLKHTTTRISPKFESEIHASSIENKN